MPSFEEITPIIWEHPGKLKVDQWSIGKRENCSQ